MSVEETNLPTKPISRLKRLSKPVCNAAGAVAAAVDHAVIAEPVDINEHCVGDRWTVRELHHLARLIAIIAMGQASHAAEIIKFLLASAPALNLAVLRQDAERRLTVSGKTDAERDASRWRRDGLIFEAISWIVARQGAGSRTFVRDPHLSSTTQGLDGLMIELDAQADEISRATIIEDKCSGDPRRVFRDEVMKAFKDYHQDKRAAELVATAATLIREVGLDGTSSTKAAAAVLDMTRRIYRASVAVTEGQDSQEKRKSLFKDYEDLDGIGQSQRVGACFITPGELRPWFDALAGCAIGYIRNLDGGTA